MELGSDSTQWSPTSSLWPKDWFDASIDAFSEAYQLAQAGKKESAETALVTTRVSDLNFWYDVHAQNVGRFCQDHAWRVTAPRFARLDGDCTLTKSSHQWLHARMANRSSIDSRVS